MSTQASATRQDPPLGAAANAAAERPDRAARRAPDTVPDWLDLVARRVADTDYGVVQITVHGSRVVQVDWTQRARFATSTPARDQE